MSFRRTLGTLIIIFSSLGIIINFSLLVLATVLVTDAIQISGIDPNEIDFADAFVGKPISIVVGFVWLGIGFLIRGKNEF